MNGLEKVNEALAKAGTFYLATVAGDAPKCRPIGFHMLRDGRLYFGVGEFKDVYRQMRENPRVEICAATGKGFLRYYGRAVFESDDALAEEALASAPALRRIYNAETGYKLGIFHLENATAEFRNMLGVEESFAFD